MRAALLVLLALVACDSGAGPGLASTSWELATLRGEPVEAGTTLTFDEAGGFEGVAACNAYLGSWVVSSGGVVGSRFSADVEAVTEAACGPRRDAFEAAYLDALESAVRWRLEGSQLVLTFPDGGGGLVFDRAS